MRQNSPNAYDQVYYGGALLAFHLDRQLKAQGKSLDAIWPALNDLHRPVSTQDFLQVLENTGGADLARQTGEILRGQQILEIQPSGGE